MASAAGWLAACSAYFALARIRSQRVIALVGAVIAAALVGMKLLPFVPGRFTGHEWLALLVWSLLGLVLRRKPRVVEREPTPAT